MTPDQSMPELMRLPKVDLHRHLEGSLRLDSLLELAQAGEVPLPSDRRQLAMLTTIEANAPRTPAHFLSRFQTVRKAFQSEAIIRRLVAEAVADARAENIVYLELHVTPAALAAERDFAFADVLEWVAQSVAAANDGQIQVNLVVSVNRHEPLSLAERAIAAAIEMTPMGVVGVDLAGDETDESSEAFIRLFERAKEAGLGVSVHAGEWAGPHSIAAALDEMGADRIAHGIRILEDPSLVRRVVEQEVPLAVCLTSNVQSGAVADYESHPLTALIQAGLRVTLNSDDPGLSGISLSTEFQIAIERLGLSRLSLVGLTMTAAQSAFLPSKSRRDLAQSIQARLGLAPGNHQL